MVTRNYTVGSISEYISTVVSIAREWDRPAAFSRVWFRGIADCNYNLLPRLYRELKEEEGEEEDLLSASTLEGNIRLEFMNRALPYMSNVYDRKEWDWYFLMQHYRVPTRLLDWTESALVALYFALCDQSGQAPAAAVWMLNPHELNDIAIKARRIVVPSEFDDFKKYLPSRCGEEITGQLPIAIDPQHTDRRMAAQQSRFTLHGCVPTPLERVPEFKALLEARYLVRILIPIRDSSTVEELKRELRLLGMRKSSVFPDLEGLAMDICELVPAKARGN